MNPAPPPPAPGDDDRLAQAIRGLGEDVDARAVRAGVIDRLIAAIIIAFINHIVAGLLALLEDYRAGRLPPLPPREPYPDSSHPDCGSHSDSAERPLAYRPSARSPSPGDHVPTKPLGGLPEAPRPGATGIASAPGDRAHATSGALPAAPDLATTLPMTASEFSGPVRVATTAGHIRHITSVTGSSEVRAAHPPWPRKKFGAFANSLLHVYIVTASKR